MKRRTFLKTAAAGGVLLSTTSLATLLDSRAAAAVTPFTTPLNIPPVLTPTSTTSTADYYDLTVAENNLQILPGNTTTVIGFNGATPGPVIRATAGRQAVVTQHNNLPATTLFGAPGDVVIHLHGAHVEHTSDGYPTDSVAPGSSRTYTYTNNQLAAPLWYHDHLMDYTAPHVWSGMAGLYLLTDSVEQGLGLPSGNQEIPLVIQDRNFDSNNQLVYTGNHDGETGNQILVNGTPQPYLDVANIKYRFRVYNGSNARPYRLELSNGGSFQVLGMEGGLLPAPVTTTSITVASAERADIVIDFSQLAVGGSVAMVNTLVSASSSVYDIIQFNVTSSQTDTSTVPSALRPLDKLNPADAVTTRDFSLGGGQNGAPWTINGNLFDPNRIDASPVLNTVEIWNWNNMSMMDHPVHMHDVMFQILNINGAPPPATHAGWKDTVIVPAGGQVQTIMKFVDFTGIYVMHCHIVEHEDDAMMAQFEVVS